MYVLNNTSDGQPICQVWIRDLTEEGIEPHPGPGRVLGKNLNGAQGENKLWRLFKNINREHASSPIAACMAQEHHLRSEDREDHQRIAHFHRILAIISYPPSGDERGGTAVFIPYSSIEANKGETDDEARIRTAQTAVHALAGRLARVTSAIAGIEVQLTSAYAPASHGPLRKQYMKRLHKYLDKNTVLSIDANCVPDELLDLKRSATTPYANDGADELAVAVAQFDLSDTAREQLGNTPFYTCHHRTTAVSRISVVFSLPFPPKMRPPLPGRHIFAFPSSLPPCLLRLFRPPSPCFFRSQRTPCWSHAARPADVPVGLAVVRPMVPTGGGGPASYGLQFYNDWFIFMFHEVTFSLQWCNGLACPWIAVDARAA